MLDRLFALFRELFGTPPRRPGPRRFRRVKLEVAALGGPRLAIRGERGQPRCAFCHDDLTGLERDLVGCARCGTVLHDGCWRELGRCPVLGCPGTRPERAGHHGSRGTWESVLAVRPEVLEQSIELVATAGERPHGGASPAATGPRHAREEGTRSHAAPADSLPADPLPIHHGDGAHPRRHDDLGAAPSRHHEGAPTSRDRHHDLGAAPAHHHDRAPAHHPDFGAAPVHHHDPAPAPAHHHDLGAAPAHHVSFEPPPVHHAPPPVHHDPGPPPPPPFDPGPGHHHP